MFEEKQNIFPGDLKKLLDGLNIHKAAGPDTIPSRVSKWSSWLYLNKAQQPDYLQVGVGDLFSTENLPFAQC